VREGAVFISKYFKVVGLCTNTSVQRLLTRGDVNGACGGARRSGKQCVLQVGGEVLTQLAEESEMRAARQIAEEGSI
jgi:hypothetical protein